MQIDWKKEYSIPQLIIKVKRAHFNQTTDTATMLKWYHEFKRKKGFKIGRRGKYKREFFLEKYSIRETSLKSRLDFYLRSSTGISIDSTTGWLRNLIKDNFPEDHEARRYNISHGTVHHWMYQIGARFDQNQKTHYTDNHESPSNVIYRDVYIKEHLLLSLRQPVWTYVQKDEVYLKRL
jgi:hypothetical protein